MGILSFYVENQRTKTSSQIPVSRIGWEYVISSSWDYLALGQGHNFVASGEDWTECSGVNVFEYLVQCFATFLSNGSS